MNGGLKFLLVVVVQIAFFILTYNLGYKYFVEKRPDLAWGISLEISLVVYVFISIITAGLFVDAASLKQKILVAFITGILFSAFWIIFAGGFSVKPLLLLASGYTGIGAGMIASCITPPIANPK